MWRAFTNWLLSLRTYRDLSPDQGLRHRINVQLRRSRLELSLEDWIQTFADPKFSSESQVPPESLLQFVYDQLGIHSGLAVGCIRPRDRLIQDLHLPLVCWFDWPHQFCQDFGDTFHIDMADEFDESHFDTVADLVVFLHRQLVAMDSLSSGQT
ncbi:hypothetical protein [Leptolyngbya sp. PCC 6406]|uniref:hypothetical protein n=1 Tax=Leptolyngbya sp. PCC 6406 TaxID=1173264 RepID=UPI0002AC5B39|nr:hypothetical protein [Leptolyngbya sp. PCC 6406]